jgi:hypothetical protein
MNVSVQAMWIGLVVLIASGAVACSLFLVFGFRYFWLLNLTLALTGGWALAGAAIGLVRNLQSAKVR